MREVKICMSISVAEPWVVTIVVFTWYFKIEHFCFFHFAFSSRIDWPYKLLGNLWVGQSDSHKLGPDICEFEADVEAGGREHDGRYIEEYENGKSFLCNIIFPTACLIPICFCATNFSDPWSSCSARGVFASGDAFGLLLKSDDRPRVRGRIDHVSYCESSRQVEAVLMN